MQQVAPVDLSDIGGRMKAKIIALANKKGGVGKSSTAINLSVSLAKLGYRTLVLDLDGQANTTSCLVNNFRELKYTIMDLFMNRKLAAGEAVVAANPGGEVIDNLFIIGAHLQQQDAYDFVNNRAGRDSILKKHLAPLVDQFDCILLDSPPDVGPATINALNAADLALIPIDGSFSLDGVADILNIIEEVDNNRLDYLILFNKYDLRSTSINTKMADLVSEYNVASTKVRTSKPINNAQMDYVPLTMHKGDRSAVEDYDKLAQEVMDV